MQGKIDIALLRMGNPINDLQGLLSRVQHHLYLVMHDRKTGIHRVEAKK
jgi:hypothetical protein